MRYRAAKLKRLTVSPDIHERIEQYGIGGGGAAVAIPLITSAIGAYGSARGGKKAANAANAGNKIPGVFRPPVGVASGLLTNRLINGFPRFGGPFAAGLNPLQTQGLDFISRTLGSGEGGMQSALQTILGASQSGISPADIELARSQTNPLFEFQKGRSLASLREAQSRGGRFFGTGALGAEADLLRGMEAERAANILPLALQIQSQRLGAAQSLPGFIAQQLGIGGAAIQAGEVPRGIAQTNISGQLQDFLRSQPENAIGFLASLMSGTPFQSPVVAPNFSQIFGSGLSGLAGSPGFLSMLQGAFQRPDTTNVNVGSGGSFGQQFGGPNFASQFVFNPSTGQFELH